MTREVTNQDKAFKQETAHKQSRTLATMWQNDSPTPTNEWKEGAWGTPMHP
ncbi:hypothetical protein KDI_32820 [Dictyobacter arantiisoli]|uniref:Uncharacterized protein n=1 Tax=Dictyobacter arantiisoli TaxID=2014874 RepID=A0A5A5TEQ3_9CHLR|nr:hypothetical protein KDI_32820 [Dictyobacter arantiisoli]